MKRQNIASIIIGGTIGFFPALLLFNSMPDSSDAQLIAGLGGLSVGPVVMMLIDAKKKICLCCRKAR
jgi:heme O synthase-like polyprenyltransferase